MAQCGSDRGRLVDYTPAVDGCGNMPSLTASKVNTMDLTHLSLAELRDLETKAKKELEKREQQEVASAREQIQAIAQNAGISLKDLMSSGTRKKSRPAAVKYRHPDNSAQQWTGRGRQPKWIKEWLDSGKSMDLLHV